jgi:TonB family protein
VRNVAATHTAATAAEASASSVNRYLETISAVLRNRWKQPAAAELGGRRPQTAVALEIAGDGHLRSARISKRSGVAAMDSSVEALLRGVRRLPPPSAYGIDAAVFSVSIAFEVD